MDRSSRYHPDGADMPAPKITEPTERANAVSLRTYQRPIDDDGIKLETWTQAIHRSTYDHHGRLWLDAGGTPDEAELRELEVLGLNRKSTVAGRTLWLGGTRYAFERAACQFNCSGTPLSNVYDLVDVAWLLLNGAGVGFKPQVGTLQGYLAPLELRIIGSVRDKSFKGPQGNFETAPTADNDWTWTIKVGDSASAWAKAIGKMFGSVHSRRAKTLVISGEDCRGPGARLKGYGWICNGFGPLAKAMSAIHEILNKKAGNLLDDLDIMDVVNRIGEVLSSRRSAQLCTVDSNSPTVGQFATAKREYWRCLACGSHDTTAGVCNVCQGPTNNHRRQSNNSELFWSKPSKSKLLELLYHADECGGDPGIINMEGARLKAPWAAIFNPCVTGDTEITVREHGEITTRSIGWLVDNKLKAEVWNGEQWSVVEPKETGYNQPTLRITLEDGRSVRCTLVHKFPWDINTGDPEIEEMLEAQFLSVGDTLIDYPMPMSDKSKGLVKVKSIEWAGIASHVYCFTEPLANRGTFNGIVTGQCVEIILGSFCNLVNNSLPRFMEHGRPNIYALERAIRLISRANYRQTCVDLRDGILQPRWHQNNDALRLCGVSLTGICQADWMTDYNIRRLRNEAIAGAYGMADELRLPRPKAVTTITPGGTISKVMGGKDVGEITEGIHKPLGHWIYNWINFSIHDPLVEAHREAGYKVLPNPQDVNNVLVCFPVVYNNVKFDKVNHPKTGDVMEVNLEPAVVQLDRYLRWNNLWCDHNASCTISYTPDELPAVADWLYENWDRGYIATAFMRRMNPLLRPEDVGQPYLPQEVVQEGRYTEYLGNLRPVDYSGILGVHDVDDGGCGPLGCPVR